MRNLFTCCFATLLFALPYSSFAKDGVPTNKSAAGMQSKPLSFIENKGQVTDQHGALRNDIDLKLDGGGLTVFVGNGEIHYQFSKQLAVGSRQLTVGNLQLAVEDGKKNVSNTIETYRLDVVLVGANKHADLVKEEAQDYYENYYLAHTPEEGVQAHSYNRITYRNIYPNIDWVLYSQNGELKYDFVVRPGGRVADIQLRYEGASKLYLENGALVAKTPFGDIIENEPFTYEASSQIEIASKYRLDGNTLRFDVNRTTETAIIIDPILKWSTYYGGTANDYIYDHTSDTAGNVYVVGYTGSSTNIATSGSHQQAIAGADDGFLAVFDKNGVRLWATYYGGTNADQLYGVAIDAGGFLCVTGATISQTGIATPGAHQTTTSTINGKGMLVKFNTAGVRQWGTYFGGTSTNAGVRCEAVACDRNGNIFVCGQGSGFGVPDVATTGAFQTSPNGAFIVKFNSAGVRQWGTFYGDWLFNGTEFNDIACDGFGNVYAAGQSHASSTMPNITTPGSHQPTITGSSGGILVKFNTSGQRLWGTYYGGNGFGIESISALAADPAGNVYVGGATTTTTGMTTTGAFQATINGSWDAFLAKFDSSGARKWGTYYGGSDVTSTESIHDIEVGAEGNIYLTGRTRSTSGLATTDAWQPAHGGGDDAFVAVFTPVGQRPYGTYFGGPGTDDGSGISCSQKGKFYLSGSTSSATGIAYGTNPHQAAYISNEAFLAQFDMDTAVFIRDVMDNLHFCAGGTTRMAYGVTHPFKPGNVFTVQLSDASGSFVTPVTIGSITSQFSDTISLTIPVNTPTGTGYRIRMLASNPAYVGYENGINIVIAALPNKPGAAGNSPICTGGTLNLSATGFSSTGWSWKGPDNFTSTQQNPSITGVIMNAAGDYIVSVENAGCKASDTVNIVIDLTPITPTAGSNSPVCTDGILNLTASSTTPGVTYSWTGPGFTSTQQNPTIPGVQVSASGNYTVTATLGNCSSSNTTVVAVNQGPIAGMYVSPNDTICAGTLATFVAVPQFTGPGPSYRWLKNGTAIPGATGLIYTSASLVTGDKIEFELLAPGSGCNTAIMSQPITMTVLSVKTTPSVTISSNPAQPRPGELATFTAVPTNGGPNPQYQWMRNGIDQPGAIYATWSTTDLTPWERISVKLTSDDPCAEIDTAISNEIIANFPTGINDVNKTQNLQLFPNPNKGSFSITGMKGNTVNIEVLNAVGQTVYSKQHTPVKGTVEVSFGRVATGVYVVKVGEEAIRFVVD